MPHRSAPCREPLNAVGRKRAHGPGLCSRSSTDAAYLIIIKIHSETEKRSIDSCVRSTVYGPPSGHWRLQLLRVFLTKWQHFATCRIINPHGRVPLAWRGLLRGLSQEWDPAMSRNGPGPGAMGPCRCATSSGIAAGARAGPGTRIQASLRRRRREPREFRQQNRGGQSGLWEHLWVEVLARLPQKAEATPPVSPPFCEGNLKTTRVAARLASRWRPAANNLERSIGHGEAL